MKKIIIVCCFIALAIQKNTAQSEMKSVWEAKFEHKTDNNYFDESVEKIVSSNEKMISLLDTKSGSILWTKDFKSITDGKLKKIDEIITMWDANCIFLFDRKMGKDQMAVLDLESGKMLWSTDKYEGITDGSIAYISELGMFAVANKKAFTMIKARSGEEIWETQGFRGALARYIYSENTIIALNYNPAAAGEGVFGVFGQAAASLGAFKSQISKINTKTGEVIWQTDMKGMVEKEIATGRPLASMKLVGDKILVTMQGLQCYDMKNGSLVWGVTHSEEAMKNVNNAIGGSYGGAKLARKAVYGAIAAPLVDGNDVYVIDMVSKSKQFVSKYDMNTGKLIWKSEDLKKIVIAPHLYKIGNKLIIQIGGYAQVQGITAATSGGLGSFGGSSGGYRVVFNQEFGPFGVEAMDATNGQIVWRSEKFKGGVTDAIVHKGQLIVASAKSLYSLNPESGEPKYEIDVKEDGVKIAEKLFQMGDNVILVCKKGVSSHAISDGKVNWVTPTKKGDLTKVAGNIAIYSNDNSDQVAIDLTDGTYTTYDARRGATTMIYDDGRHIVVIEKDKISKLKTKN
jgi:outer membrane protein assembly factor BamB